MLAADRQFEKQLAVVLVSVARLATRPHRVFVLHRSFTPGEQEQYRELGGGALDVCWLDTSSSGLDDTLLPTYLSSASLFRLLMGELVPRDVERVIYLDCDVVARRPLDELWEIDLAGCAVGAVRDPVVPWAAAPNGLPWSELGVPPDMRYFNSGVLVVDMESWRRSRLGERSLRLLDEHRFPYGDQCALNTAIAGTWAPIAPAWNIQAGHLVGDGTLAWVTESTSDMATAIADPAIVHYNTSPWFARPWTIGREHPYRDLWFEHLDLTPWRGWRPSKPGRARALAGRIRAVGRTLLRG